MTATNITDIYIGRWLLPVPGNKIRHLSCDMRFPTMLYVQPAKAQILDANYFPSKVNSQLNESMI